MDEAEERNIWPIYEAFYIRSMLFNARSAATSVTQVNAVLHAVAENSPEDPVAALPVFHLLGELQNLVVQSAALSRYFWPARPAHEWRGACLRRAFAMSDDNPLRSRNLRNAIEHFDEQLDVYLERGIVGNILPEYVGPSSDRGDIPIHLFRGYFIDTGVFELLGNRYEIEPLAQEISRVHELLRRMESNGGRLALADA
ncbi:MAG: hypothetical protein KF693_10625 [Nitrospira sp.]|nr:hypothetical protein [Nitrospira sp.]